MNTEHILQAAVCMLAVDGRIDEPETRFMRQLQQRLGAPVNALDRALQQAQQGKGRVEVPDDPAEQQRVFAVLARAALADGIITPPERRILDAVGARIGLRRDLIEHTIGFYAGENRKPRQSQTPLATVAPPPPSTRICPKCGAEQALDRRDCLRCGIVFSRFQADRPLESQAAQPEDFEVPAYEQTGAAASQLEQVQSISALLNHAGGVLLLIVVLVAVGFWLTPVPELGGYRYVIMLALVAAAAAIMAHFAILNVAGVVTRGEVVNKWVFQSRWRYYGAHGRQQSSYLEYVFHPAHTAPDEMRRGKAAVSKSQADRYRIGAPVTVRYLPGIPWIHRLEVW